MTNRKRLTIESARRPQKSWADTQGFRTGVMGEIVDGVPIREENRATVYEKRREGILVLQRILRENYLRKDIRAVLFGVQVGDEHQYAVFVQGGFLKEV